MALDLSGAKTTYTSPDLLGGVSKSIENTKGLRELLLDKLVREAFQKSINPETGKSDPTAYREHLKATGYSFSPEEQQKALDYAISYNQKVVEGLKQGRQIEALGGDPNIRLDNTPAQVQSPTVPTSKPELATQTTEAPRANSEGQLDKTSRPVPLSERAGLLMSFSKTKKEDPKVKAIQDQLTQLGFKDKKGNPLKSDSKYGTDTNSAVEDAIKAGYKLVVKEDGTYGFEKTTRLKDAEATRLSNTKPMTVINPKVNEPKDIAERTWASQKPMESVDELPAGKFNLKSMSSDPVIQSRLGLLQPAFDAQEQMIKNNMRKQLALIPVGDLDEMNKAKSELVKDTQNILMALKEKMLGQAGSDQSVDVALKELGLKERTTSVSEEAERAKLAEREVTDNGKTYRLHSKEEAEAFRKVEQGITNMKGLIDVADRTGSLRRIGALLDADFARILGVTVTESFSKNMKAVTPELLRNKWVGVRDWAGAKDALIGMSSQLTEAEFINLTNELIKEMSKAKTEYLKANQDKTEYKTPKRFGEKSPKEAFGSGAKPNKDDFVLPNGKRDFAAYTKALEAWKKGKK